MIVIIVIILVILGNYCHAFQNFNSNYKIMSKSFVYISDDNNYNNDNNNNNRVNKKIISIIISITTMFNSFQLPYIANADDTTTTTTTSTSSSTKEVIKGIIEVDGEIGSIYRKARYYYLFYYFF